VALLVDRAREERVEAVGHEDEDDARQDREHVGDETRGQALEIHAASSAGMREDTAPEGDAARVGRRRAPVWPATGGALWLIPFCRPGASAGPAWRRKAVDRGIPPFAAAAAPPAARPPRRARRGGACCLPRGSLARRVGRQRS